MRQLPSCQVKQIAQISPTCSEPAVGHPKTSCPPQPISHIQLRTTLWWCCRFSSIVSDNPPTSGGMLPRRWWWTVKASPDRCLGPTGGILYGSGLSPAHSPTDGVCGLSAPRLDRSSVLPGQESARRRSSLRHSISPDRYWLPISERTPSMWK